MGRGSDRQAPAGALIAINSGANVNFDRLQYVSERAEIGERAAEESADTLGEIVRGATHRAAVEIEPEAEIA